MKEKWATVQREGFTIPLIGVPESAVIETCDCCGEEIGVSQATVETGGVYCEKCRNQEKQ